MPLPWSLDDVPPPWGDRPALLDHVARHLDPDGPGLRPGGDRLPDERPPEPGSDGPAITWAPGALDGVMGRHLAAEPDEDAVPRIVAALVDLCTAATAAHAASFYAALVDDATLGVLDALVAAIRDDDRIESERLHDVARWLAFGAADRAPLKVAIAFLGMVGADDPDEERRERDVLLTLARHEEFTLFALVALLNRGTEPVRALLDVARRVTGWGRIHCIERLDGSTDDEVRAWMLREGWQNDVMVEYTALACARTGGLLEALALPAPDDALLVGAGRILAALASNARGGPGEGFEAWPDGAAATERWLALVRERLQARGDLALSAIDDALALGEFVADDDGVTQEPMLGWPARRTAILAHADAIARSPGLPDRVRRALAHGDRLECWNAIDVGRRIGIDAWEALFARVEAGEDWWWHLMQPDDPARIARAAALAERRLDLAAITRGPLGTGFEGMATPDVQALDFVVQGLHAHPGIGWPILEAALRCVAFRPRNGAVRALDAWDRAQGPPAVEPALRALLAVEPNARLRENVRRVLDGRGYEVPEVRWDEDVE